MAEPAPHALALGRIPSGLFILTAGRAAAAAGMLVSFVQQIGFEPPAVICAVHKSRERLLALIRGERTFCLSVVPEGGKKLVGHFAAGFGASADAFAGIDTETAANGVPVPKAAAAHLVLELLGEADWTDHVVVCGQVVAGAADADAAPWVHLRRNGLSY